MLCYAISMPDGYHHAADAVSALDSLCHSISCISPCFNPIKIALLDTDARCLVVYLFIALQQVWHFRSYALPVVLLCNCSLATSKNIGESRSLNKSCK